MKVKLKTTSYFVKIYYLWVKIWSFPSNFSMKA